MKILISKYKLLFTYRVYSFFLDKYYYILKIILLILLILLFNIHYHITLLIYKIYNINFMFINLSFHRFLIHYIFN